MMHFDKIKLQVVFVLKELQYCVTYTRLATFFDYFSNKCMQASAIEWCNNCNVNSRRKEKITNKNETNN